MDIKVSTEEKAVLKSQAILAQKQEGYYSMRILSNAGNFTSEQLSALSKISLKYGKGYLGLTTRLCIEIPYIKYEDIDIVKKELAENNLVIGGTGKKVRPVTACKGTVCVHGQIDTQALAGKIHNEYFGRELPAKFKIGVVGCPNNCGKAQLNDIGIIPHVDIEINENNCVLCGKCIKVCKDGALVKENKKLVYKEELCVHCGKCATACGLGAIKKKSEGLKLYIGGRFGRKAKMGKPLNKLFKEEEILPMLDKIMTYYNENANPLERLASMIERIGFDEVEKNLL
ncbi:4Fe-4S binding protein [uncultured Clostridium sp.]|uniref:4Fe-4S binding protein n=1 Tax=uncultured Clostridium sp. TaxID=59620 RepID=UPI00258C6230|nr:4Fe-4S binding protein [uncultured Clostridium sp.]MDU1348083.1 4Fe-4S binding protein [Clostridium argentinense]